MSALISARRDSARDTSRTLVPARSASCSRVAVITPVSNSAYERTPSQTAKVTPGRGPDVIRFRMILERSCESMVYSHGFRWATYALGRRAVNTTWITLGARCSEVSLATPGSVIDGTSAQALFIYRDS